MLLKRALRWLSVLLYLPLILSQSPLVMAQLGMSGKFEIIPLVEGQNAQLLAAAYVLEDKKGELSWQQALSQNEWTKPESNDLNLGITQSTYWFRVDLQYQETQTRVFQVHYPLLDYVDFYLIKQGALIKHIATGDRRPFHNRNLEDNDFVISHYHDDRSVLTLLIKVKTQGTMVLPLSSTNIERYAQESAIENMAYGVYFGISVALLIYNFMLLIYLKDKNYLYYCIFVSIILLSALAYTGHGFYLIWPEYSDVNEYITPVASALGFLAASVFMASFLQISSRGEWGKVVNRLCLGLSFFVIFVSIFVNYSDSIKIMSLVQLILTVLFLGSSIYLWRRGVSEAKYFTIAWVFFIVGNMTSAFRVLGVLPSNILTVYANLFGNVFEMLLLSMGLAYRFETMRKFQAGLSRELRLAQQDAIENLEKYRDLFEKSPVGLFRYERVVDRFYSNIKSNELINNHINIRKFLQDELEFHDYKYLIKHGALTNKLINYDKDNFYNLSLFTIKNNAGRIIEIEGSLQDVSEQKRSESLRLANEQEKLSSLTQLIFGISHQFNTPLGVMLTTEDLIKDGLKQLLEELESGCLRKEDLLQTLNMIKDAVLLASENTKSLSTMLKDLRYSINTRTNLNLSSIQTATLFEDLFGYFKSQLKENGENCLLELDVKNSGIATINSDYEILSDIILRLFENTHYHAYEQSKLAGKISISIKELSESIEIEYSDDGRGLNEMERESIFIPFFTGNSRKKDNSGLGMYIVHNQIVKVLLGKVSLPKSDQGFCISIQLPKTYQDGLLFSDDNA
jgi:signal transduction histidine kinase